MTHTHTHTQCRFLRVDYINTLVLSWTKNLSCVFIFKVISSSHKSKFVNKLYSETFSNVHYQTCFSKSE